MRSGQSKIRDINPPEKSNFAPMPITMPHCKSGVSVARATLSRNSDALHSKNGLPVAESRK
jgi:hypothetical protein